MPIRPLYICVQQQDFFRGGCLILVGLSISSGKHKRKTCFVLFKPEMWLQAKKNTASLCSSHYFWFCLESCSIATFCDNCSENETQGTWQTDQCETVVGMSSRTECACRVPVSVAVVFLHQQQQQQVVSNGGHRMGDLGDPGVLRP